MADVTKIEWADATFNPWMGCTKVSPACDHCYAERDFDLRRHIVKWGPGHERKRTRPANWEQPLLWNRQHDAFFAEHGRRRRVFCASLADVFDNEVPDAWRADLFALIEATPNLDWLLLTKRIGNAERMIMDALKTSFLRTNTEPPIWPWSNVWLGATICNQEEADRDIPKLLQVPAAVRFLSIEPMLGPIDLSYWIEPTVYCAGCGAHYPVDEAIPDTDGHPMGADKCARCGDENVMGTWWGTEAIEERSRPDDMELEDWDHGYKLHWVIAGGESGHHARPSHPDWFRSLRDQCAAAGVPFLFKQWGEWTPGENVQRHSGTVASAFHDNDAWFFSEENLADSGGHIDDEPDLYRIGKKAAGRRLDGVEHNGFPELGI